MKNEIFYDFNSFIPELFFCERQSDILMRIDF